MSRYTESVEATLKGLVGISTGICPGCKECRDEYGQDESVEPYFSWSNCDICGSTLGGAREPWHALDKHNEIVHGDCVCTDCVMYLANGDEPIDE